MRSDGRPDWLGGGEEEEGEKEEKNEREDEFVGSFFVVVVVEGNVSELVKMPLSFHRLPSSSSPMERQNISM